MSKSIVNFIIDTYLSSLIEIDTKSVKASLLKGTVSLSNLKFKPSFFDSMDLPNIEILNGYIGSLDIKVSVPLFYNNPIKVKISKVFFNAQQRNVNNISEQNEIARMEKIKMNKLNNIEGIAVHIEKYMKEVTESKLTMCQKIISNLDIEINDVFFRFEDSVTSSKTAHVMGIVIKNIMISPIANNINGNYIGKEIKVSNMNMFLDSLADKVDSIINSEGCNVEVDEALAKSLGDQKDFYIFFMDEITNKNTIFTAHQYLLYNCDFDSKVIVNKDINTKTQKRFDMELTISNIELYSSIKQIEIINTFINYAKIKRLYQKGIYNNFYTKKYDKDALLVYMDSYMKYYKTKYIDGKIEGNVFSFENRDSFESGKELADIVTVRKAALVKMDYSMKLSDINSKITKLEAKWFGAKSKELDDLNKKKQELLNTENDVKEQIDKILSQLDNNNENNTNVIVEEQQETIKGEKQAQAIYDIISIKVVSLKMSIDDEYSKKFLSLELSTLSISFENRFNGYKLSILLSAISLLQFISNNQYFPEILYTKKTKENENLIEFSYEHNPNIETSDNLLIMNSTALLYIVSDYFVISTLIGKFKKIFKAINYKAIRSDFKEKVIKNIKDGYIEKMLTEMSGKNKFTIDIKLNLKLPSIVYPLDVAQIKSRKCVLLDGGLFTLSTILPKKNKNISKIKLDDDIYYDKYLISVKGITLSTCDNYMMKADRCALKKIINDTFLNTEIRVIADGSSVLDKRVEIESTVSSLDIKISDEQIDSIMNYGGTAVKEAKKLIKKKVQFENNIIPNEEIDNDVNMISTSVLSKKEVKENEEESISLLILERIKEYQSNLNKTLTIKNSKTLNKESIKLDAKFISSGMNITFYKKMTTDEIKIFNSDLPSLDKSISPISTPMEEKPFIAIKASDINTHITISDKANVKIIQSLNSLSIKDVEQYINSKNELNFYVHPNHQFILRCEASKGYKNIIEPFGTMKFKFKPEENKTSLSILLLPILIKPNVTSSSRIVPFLNYYITLYAKLLKEDSNLDEDCKKITSLKKSRLSTSKGINLNYFSLMKKDIAKYTDKKSLLDSVKNISTELANTLSTKKTGTSSKKSQTVIENKKSMVKFGIEVKKVLIHLPIDETKEKCPLIEISTNVTSKYKSSYDIDVEYNSKKTKAIYYTYTKLTAMTNTMITKVNLSIIDSDDQKYTLLDNFRMTLRSSAYLALESQNVITNIELIVEPIVIEANVMHFSLIDKINQKIKKYNEDILVDYKIAKTELPMSFGVNLKLFSKIQKEISNKVKTVSKKVIFESMFNISKFNWYYHFDFSLDKFTLHLYKPSTKPNEKLPLFTISVFQTSLTVITNNDTVDAMNFANALVEIISAKEIPIEQFNIVSMYRYALLKAHLRVNYYNPLVSTEEPLIEPYSFIARLTKVSKVTRLKFELLSDEMLNINLSAKVLLMISKLMKAINSEKPSDDNDYNSALVKIRNFTGVDISVVFDVNPADKIEIKNGEVRDFTYKEILKRQAKKNVVSHISDEKISINIMGHTSIKSFDYNGNTSNIYRISTNNEGMKNHTVDVNVTATMINSVKVITISSCIKVNNQTELDMYLTVRDDKKSETRKIKAKEMFYVPLGWIDLKKKIYIKKEENDPDIKLYNTFCSVLYEEEEVEIGSTTIAMLKDSDSKSTSSDLETFERVIQLKESVYVTVDVYVFETIKNDTNSNNTLNPIDIVINPPVIIENQIPTQFPFKVTDYLIDPNGRYFNLLEKYPIHNIYPDDNRTLMKISLNYYTDVFNSQLFNIYELKDYITLVNVDEDQFKCSIKLVDMYSVYKYDSMICNIVPEKSTSIARMYIFYFEYVISNCLLFPLVMIPTETTLKSTIKLNRKAVTLISSKSKVMQVQSNEYLSHPFRMDTYGLSGMIKWKNLQRPNSIAQPYRMNPWKPPDVAITISTSPLYPNSTLVMFEPRFLFINKTPLYLKIKGENDKSSVGVETNGLKEILTTVGNEFYQIIIADKVGKTSVERKFISDYFNITKVDEFDVKIQIEKNEAFTLYKDKPYVFSYDDLSYYLIFRISITTQDNASLFITATLPDKPLLKLVNETDTKIEIAVSQSELITLLPGKKVPFAWKNNEIQSTVLYCRMFTSEMTFSFSKFDKNEFTVTNSKGETKKVHLSVSTESQGITRVFSIKYKDDEIEKLSAFHQFYLKKKIPKATKYNCSLFGIGISIIDNKPQEIFYASFYGIDVKISSSILKSQHIVKDIKKYLLFVKNIQLDYCLNDSFRNVFHPKLQILPSNESQVMNNKDILCLPFVQIFICHQITHNLITEEKVEKYPQVDTIIQEFCVNLEQTAFSKIFDMYHIAEMFIHDITDIKKDDKAMMIVDDVKVAPFSELVDTEKKKRRMVLINYLFLSAIKFELTIKLDIDDLNLKYVPPLINKIVLSLGDSLSSITKSPIKLGEMIYQNVFINTKKLISLIGAHYVNQGLTQVYKIMGTTDLLTNPVKLVDNIGTGFVELFNEPRKGFLQGPNKYGSGLQKGVNSLLKNVGGSDSIVNVTGTLMSTTKKGKGKKKKEENKEEMSGVTESTVMKKGAEEINQGFQGVIENPYKNAKINGVQGFIKGLGTGFLGTILTPLSSMLTFSNSVSAGMKNTAIKFSGGKIKTCRFRHPRVIYQNEPLTEYDANLAEVNEILHRMKKTSYNKIFLFADIKKEGDEGKYLTLILTDRFFLLTYNMIEEPLMIRVRDVASCEVHIEGEMYSVTFIMNTGRRKGFKLYEQKVACRLYDLFKKITSGNIPIDKSNTIYENEF